MLATVVILALAAVVIAVVIAVSGEGSSGTPAVPESSGTAPSVVSSVSTSLPILDSPVITPSAQASPIR